jgi:hypothetical protein
MLAFAGKRNISGCGFGRREMLSRRFRAREKALEAAALPE